MFANNVVCGGELLGSRKKVGGWKKKKIKREKWRGFKLQCTQRLHGHRPILLNHYINHSSALRMECYVVFILHLAEQVDSVILGAVSMWYEV